MYHGEVRMTGSGPAVINPAMLEDAPETEVFESRFGPVTIYRKQPIVFPNGMLGMPDKLQFCLTDLPSEKMARFKLLQSLDDAALSFITLPVDVANTLVDRADVETAARDTDIPLEHLVLLFIVSVHRENGVVKLSVNARAPILLHALRRTATQYVFHNAKYQIRQSLTL